MLEFELDFVRNALVFFTLIGRLLVVVASKGVKVLLMANMLFFFGDIQATEILLKLALGDAVLIFGVLEGDLGFFLELSQLVEVLEDEML